MATGQDEEPVHPTAPGDRTTVGRFGTSSRADAYSAWAQRLRDKRVRAQEHIQESKTGPTGNSGGSEYWSTDALFNQSRSVQEEEARTNAFSRIRDLLAVFNLEEGASLDQVTASYRRLAKLHHPDRYVGADEATRERHSEQMQQINTAYRALRDQLRV